MQDQSWKVGQLGPGATLSSNMSCQTKLMNAAIVCSHAGSRTQCKRVTNLSRFNLLAFKYFEGDDGHFRYGDMGNPQSAFS